MRTHLTPIFEQTFNPTTVISLTFDLNKIESFFFIPIVNIPRFGSGIKLIWKKGRALKTALSSLQFSFPR